MYPESHAAALLETLETERAIEELVELALELWLPLAEAAVLQAAAAPPPDPTAAADQDAQWSYLVDALVLYGIGVIAADAFGKAYEAFTGVPLSGGEAALASLKPSLAGMPSRDDLRERASSILKTRLGINVPEVESVMAEHAPVREFVNQHLGNIRGRIMDAVARVFKRVRKTNDDAPTPEAAREDVEPVFDPADPQWQAAATEVGRTQATGTLNAALEAAASGSRKLMIEWVAILDTHTREGHREADGQRQPPGVPFDVDGEQLRFPGDPLGDIDNTINCRCRLFAFFAGEPRMGVQASLDTSHASEKVASMTDYRSFTSVLAVIGTPTDDGRMFANDIDLSFRDFPLPLLWQRQSVGGHYDAFTVGVIESAMIVGNEVIGNGYMLNTPEADEAAMQIQHQVTGPSVDLGDAEWEMRDSAGNTITEEQWWEDPDMEVLMTVLSAKVLAATLVATPAFGQTSITIGELVAKGEDALVAAAALMEVELNPVYDPRLFEKPEFSEPTYPHITEHGRIQGHLAAWNVCHVGIQDRCVLAPRSQTDYSWFHTSPPVKTEAGAVKVGRLTVGGGHAGPKLSVAPAIAHYDNVGTCFALVHVGEDEHGIWFSGVPAPGASIEQIAQGLAAPLSGDWRAVGGNLELVAALSVNTPGFPLVASGASDNEGDPVSLIASLGPCASEVTYAPGGVVSEGTALDQVDFARQIVTEWRAAEKRDASAKALIHAEVRRQALEIIGKVD